MIRNLAYGAEQSSQALDLFIAQAPQSSGSSAAAAMQQPISRPLLVFIHGGLWVESVAPLHLLQLASPRCVPES